MKNLLLLALISAVATATPLEEARRLIASGLHQPAIDILKNEVTSKGANSEEVREFASALFYSKSWAEAIPWLERAEAADPESAIAWRLFKAKSLSYLGRYREAMNAYEYIGSVTEVSERLLWEHLIAAMAADAREQQFVVLGKLAMRALDPNTESEVKIRIASMLDIYESASLSSGNRVKFAEKTIVAWSKQ